MSSYVLGLAIGLVVGTICGYIVAAMLFVAAQADRDRDRGRRDDAFGSLMALHELASVEIEFEDVLRPFDSKQVLPPLPSSCWPEIFCESCRLRPAGVGVVYDGVVFRVCGSCRAS